MFRRFVSGLVVAPAQVAVRLVTVKNEDRENLTKHLTALKEECKGQSMDLADMSDAAKMAMRSFQDSVKKSDIEDAQFKGKMTTLAASVKAYNTRLSNLQNESRSIQAEVDALLKLLWGTEQPHAASFSKPPPTQPRDGLDKQDDFCVEPPPIAKVVEELNKDAPVEHVDGERVSGETKSSTSKTTEEPKSDEIEVETIEIEVEDTSDSQTPHPKPAPAQENVADTMKITDITKDLYERGVNFSDCLDARSLRQRYQDVLSGKIPSGPTQKKKNSYSEPLNANTSQPRMPPRNTSTSSAPQSSAPNHGNQYQQAPPNTTDTGITSDPYPNAHRKMIDAMKYVWEVKQELAAEKGIDPNSVDLWSGRVKLEDQKRLYDYPSIQSYPIEVRQKGDIPH